MKKIIVNNKIKTVMALTVIAMALAPSLAAAYIPTPTVPVGGQTLTGSSIVRIINDVVQILMSVSVVIGVGYFVYGAIQYFALAKTDDGKAKMKNAVIGIALILAIGLILNTISGLIARGLNVG